MDPVACPICLENFQGDEAYIPDDLNCNCILIVHWKCWEPWSGECLYCRNIESLNIQPNVNVVNIIINEDRYRLYNGVFLVFFLMYIFSIVSKFYGSNE